LQVNEQVFLLKFKCHDIILDDIQFFNKNYLNKKQELPVAAMFVNRSGQNEQSV
jgi:hypothetical protein